MSADIRMRNIPSPAGGWASASEYNGSAGIKTKAKSSFYNNPEYFNRTATSALTKNFSNATMFSNIYGKT